MPLSTARQILKFAQDGLHILVVGEWADPRVPGHPKAKENHRLGKVISQLLEQPTVHRVDDKSDIPGGIAALGLKPDVQYESHSGLLHARRSDHGVDYCYFVNSSDAEDVNHDVTISTSVRPAIPYALDLWTGKVSRIVQHESGHGWVRLRLTLGPGTASAIAIARPGWREGPGAVGRVVAETDADEIHNASGHPVVRASRAGTYQTKYDTGRVVHTRLKDVPDKIPLTSWELTVKDWRPGSTATETKIKRHKLHLDELQPWSKLQHLADVSGVGNYVTTFKLGKPWTGGFGAQLHLGKVVDTFRVKLNGDTVPPVSPLDPVMDVGHYLKAGTNRIEVEVASTLYNRLRVTYPEIYGSISRKDYGLIGPVYIIPYGEKSLK